MDICSKTELDSKPLEQVKAELDVLIDLIVDEAIEKGWAEELKMRWMNRYERVYFFYVHLHNLGRRGYSMRIVFTLL